MLLEGQGGVSVGDCIGVGVGGGCLLDAGVAAAVGKSEGRASGCRKEMGRK